jgi:hypothetical protein
VVLELPADAVELSCFDPADCLNQCIHPTIQTIEFVALRETIQLVELRETIQGLKSPTKAPHPFRKKASRHGAAVRRPRLTTDLPPSD